MLIENVYFVDANKFELKRKHRRVKYSTYDTNTLLWKAISISYVRKYVASQRKRHTAHYPARQ